MAENKKKSANEIGQRMTSLDWRLLERKGVRLLLFKVENAIVGRGPSQYKDTVLQV